MPDDDRNTENDPTILAAAESIERLLGGEPTAPVRRRAAAPTDETGGERLEREAADDQAGEAEAPAEDADQAPEGESESDDAEAQAEKAGEKRMIELPNGEQVDLADLVKERLLHADYTRKTQQLAEERRTLQTEVAETTGSLRQRIEAVDRFFGFLMETDPVLSQVKGQDLSKLATENPTEWVQVKAALEDRGQKYQAWQQAREKMMAEQVANYKKAEQEALVAAWPDVTDRAKIAPEVANMDAYLKARGFSRDEAANIMDHRFVMVIRDAAKAWQQERAKPEAAKKVVNVPKVQKPGVSTSKSDPGRERQSALSQRLKKSGRLEDAAALFESLI